MNSLMGPVVTNFKKCIMNRKVAPIEHFCFARHSLALSFGMVLAAGVFAAQPSWADEPAPDITQKAHPPIEGVGSAKSQEASSSAASALRSDIANDITIYGVEMQEAFGRDFFTHLRLRPIAYSVTKDGFTEMLLRLPKSSQLRALLNCYVVLDDSGKIIRARLHLKRRAISDRLQGAFARDYAKSFVQAAVPESELDTGASIGNEIFFRQEITKLQKADLDSRKDKADPEKTYFKLGSGRLKEGDIIITGGAGELPAIPKRPSEFYQVFIGKEKTSRMNLEGVVLRFTNKVLEGEDTLVISVARKDDPQDGEDDSKEVDYGNMPLHIPKI
jgi:hypothetical protein